MARRRTSTTPQPGGTKVLYPIHKGPQEAFMTSPAEEVLYGGAAFGGKSYALRAFLVSYCLQYPGATVVLFRRTFRELEDTHIIALQNELPSAIAEYKSSSHDFIFKNGSVLMCRFMEKESDARSYDTFEADAMAFDELTAFSEFQYVYLLTRCRSTKPWWPGRKIRAATNPGNVGHGWVKRRFIDHAPPYEIKRGPANEGAMLRQFIPAFATDNLTGMAADPDYLNVLQGLPYEEYRAKALGDWEIFAGQFFGRWRSDVHVCKTFTPSREWKRYISVDWGLAAPRAIYWAARPPMGENFVWLYREQYGAGVPTREQARLVREAVLAADETIEFCVMDPAAWAREKDADGNLMESVADIFSAQLADICPVVRGNNERVMGASLFREMLDWTGAETPDGNVSVLVPPRLKVMDCCREFIRTVPTLVHSPNNAEDVDTSQEDHCLAGWTGVLTQDGWTRIDHLAGAKITGYNTLVISVQTESGEELVCTPNHRILTPSGWVEARSLKPGMEILWSSATPCRNTEDCTTGYAASTFNATESVYTDGSGQITSETCRQDSTSTMQTTTGHTMDSRISSSSLPLNTSAIILPANGLLLPSEKHEDGTLREPVERVIAALLANNGVKRVAKVGQPFTLDAVWDITLIEEPHAFVANGGFVVHNSYDSVRYLLRALFNAPERPKARRIFDTPDGLVSVA